MAEYIEREALYKKVTEKYRDISAGAYPFNIVAYDMAQLVKNAPAAGVVEVRHGECPVCGGKQIIRQACDNGYYVEVDAEQQEMSVWLQDECLAVFSIDYCPNCGAKMDGKGEGE